MGSTWRPLPYVAPAPRARGGALKRGIDIVFAAAALVLLSPLLLLTGALVWLFMGRPVIFGHTRIGLDGSTFICYKFRTMVADAQEVLDRHLASNADAAREWRQSQKLRDDPRVNCVGKILRKSSIDELPQLFNVLRGDMSIVGPRPIIAEELERYGTSARKCFRARPGITGIWQVSGRSSLTYRERVALDRYYAQKWSIWLDLMILVKTIPAVLKFHETA
jgi:exopolysaccharide production protein ExoY